MKNLNVIVVGGGIGGLQTALALGSDGHKVIVLESAPKFLEVRFAPLQVLHFYFCIQKSLLLCIWKL